MANRLGVSPNDVETSERGEAEDVDDRALYREVQRQIADDHLEYLLTESGVALAAMAPALSRARVADRWAEFCGPSTG